jgi:branched-chain amino acid transport system permease protein
MNQSSSRARRLTWRPAVAGAIVAFVCLLPLIFTGSYGRQVLIVCGINIVVACSVRLINLTGQFSLGTGAMMTLGGYLSALLAIHYGVSPWIGFVVAGAAAFIVACVFGFAFVRLKGMYFAMVTLFFAQIVTLIVLDLRSFTGGINGLFNIPWPQGIRVETEFYYVIVALCLLCLAVFYLLEHSRLGLVFRGIKQTDTLCESVGINVRMMKVLAFGLGSLFAGIAGAMYGHYMQALNPSAFGFAFTLYAVIYMVVGGSNVFVGPILGATVLTLANNLLRAFAKFQPLFFAAVLLLIVFLMPEGLVGLPERTKRAVLRIRERRSGRAAQG